MQRDEKRRLLDRRRFAAPIFCGQILKAEFVLGRNFPEKSGIERRSFFGSARQKRSRARRLEGKEDMRGLDFCTASGRELHLISIAGLRQYRACLEGAVFFKVKIHS